LEFVSDVRRQFRSIERMTPGEPPARPAYFFPASPVRFSAVKRLFFAAYALRRSHRTTDNARVSIDRDHDDERESRIDAFLEAIRTKATRRGRPSEPTPQQIGEPALDVQPVQRPRSRSHKGVTERQFLFEPDLRHETAPSRNPDTSPAEGV
jgi:hypothetical protein